MPFESDHKRRERRQEARYREEVGEPHNLPEDHPDRWQWEYTGSEEDKERLHQMLGIPEQEDEPIEGQMELI